MSKPQTSTIENIGALIAKQEKKHPIQQVLDNLPSGYGTICTIPDAVLDTDEQIRRDAYEAGKKAGLTLGWNLRRLAELTGKNLDESLELLEKIK